VFLNNRICLLYLCFFGAFMGNSGPSKPFLIVGTVSKHSQRSFFDFFMFSYWLFRGKQKHAQQYKLAMFLRASSRNEETPRISGITCLWRFMNLLEFNLSWLLMWKCIISEYFTAKTTGFEIVHVFVVKPQSGPVCISHVFKCVLYQCQYVIKNSVCLESIFSCVKFAFIIVHSERLYIEFSDWNCLRYNDHCINLWIKTQTYFWFSYECSLVTHTHSWPWHKDESWFVVLQQLP